MVLAVSCWQPNHVPLRQPAAIDQQAAAAGGWATRELEGGQRAPSPLLGTAAASPTCARAWQMAIFTRWSAAWRLAMVMTSFAMLGAAVLLYRN
jgi:hypothetical protein